jgi:alpha-tubulin suppressor-like RCC1 family protein
MDRSKPTQITSVSGLVACYTGCNHSIVVDVEGNIYGFGSNSFGQLGVAGWDDKFKPTRIPIHVHNVKSVSIGWNHNIIIANTNSKQIFSANSYSPNVK